MRFSPFKRTLIAMSLGVLAFQAKAQDYDGHMGLDVSLSNDAANFGLYSLRESAQELTNLGVDYFFNRPGDKFVDVFGSISRKGMADNQNLELGIAGKVFYADGHRTSESGYGAMLGVNGRYWLPTEMPMAVGFDGLYAPPITSFGDVKSASQADVRLEVRILPSAMAYVGYQKLNVEFNKASNVSMDDSLNIGVNVAFE